MRSEPVSASAAAADLDSDGRYIYIACPWSPKGGGMFKVADYLIQAQSLETQAGFAELRPLDTRGGANAIYSLWMLAKAVGKLVRGRLQGKLAGVHVNMAERLSLFRKSVIIVSCRALGVPVVLHLHAAQLHQSYRALPPPLQAVTRWVFSLPASCVVLGASARRFVIDELKVPAARVEVVNNGVPGPVKPPLRASAAQRVQRVLFVGNLSERKGVTDLLQALAVPGTNTTRLQLTFAGGGDVRQYQKKAVDLGVDGLVRFLGWADQSQVARLMHRADILVLPSYDEGLPLVILEALANGVAVVCTPVGEIPLTLTDGLNACFVEPGNSASIAAGLQKVLNEPEFRQHLGQNGRALYDQNFSLPRFFASVARIHQRHFGVAGQPLKLPSPAEEDLQ
jgi:glycosyltransferase involved in cell wall biosynthesis